LEPEQNPEQDDKLMQTDESFPPSRRNCSIYQFCEIFGKDKSIQMSSTLQPVTESKNVGTAHNPLKNSGTNPDNDIGGQVSVATALVRRVLSTERKFRSMCGISRTFFKATLKQISLNVPQQSALTKEEQLVLFFIKLKLNERYTVMSVYFDISEKTVSKVFHSVLEAMYELASKKVWWHSRDEVKAVMPESFKLHYPDTRVIIDASEIKIETPKTIEARNLCYSQYKKNYTAKFLIGIAPCGMVTYISKAYGGRVTDNHLTGDCGFLDLLESGDMVMADKGFPLIEEQIVLGKKGFLVMPPFNRAGRQFSSEQNRTCYLIASVRIHVERAIQRMKTFKILQFLDHTLYNELDKVLVIISHCINHFGPLINEDKNDNIDDNIDDNIEDNIDDTLDINLDDYFDDNLNDNNIE
jgi:hypothetical protein